jgi:hypothetical protein
MLLSNDWPHGFIQFVRLLRRAKEGRSNSVNRTIEEKNRIQVHPLAFFSCHHDTSSLIFDRALAATHEA